MQGIYKGFPVMLHDSAWTCILDMVQDEEGSSRYGDALFILYWCLNHGSIIS